MNILVKYETNLKMCVKVKDIYPKHIFHEKLINSQQHKQSRNEY